MNIVESKETELVASDILTTVQIVEKTAKAPVRYDKINVLASKSAQGVDLAGKVIFDKNTVKDDILELEELNFFGEIKIWNLPSITQDMIDEMALYGQTVVCLSGRLEDFKTLDFGDLIVWASLSDTDISSFETIASASKRGVMLDTHKEGKLLFTLCQLLKNTGQVQYSTQINNANFTGINNAQLAKYLDDKGISYWIKTLNKTWARGLWLGRIMACKIYQDEIIRYNVRESISNFLGLGLPYDADTIDMLEVKILASLQTLSFVKEDVNIIIPPQNPSHIAMGIISNINVNYATHGEIRSVEVSLGGV